MLELSSIFVVITIKRVLLPKVQPGVLLKCLDFFLNMFNCKKPVSRAEDCRLTKEENEMKFKRDQNEFFLFSLHSFVTRLKSTSDKDCFDHGDLDPRRHSKQDLIRWKFSLVSLFRYLFR